ncbi:MAG: 3-oxoadipate enol-lactonase [Thalassobaculaceae bacterium]
MPQTNANGITLNYQLDGPEDQPVLLFSNSLASNLHMWDPQIAAVADDFRVLRYDSRGHGGSDAPADDYTIDQLADDALALLDTLGIEKVFYCGLSKGGMVGQKLARRNPDRLHAAVLCATSSYMGPADLWQGRINTARTEGMGGVVEATLARWFTEDFHESDPGAVDKVREMVMTTPVDGFIGCCRAIQEMDQRNDLGEIDLPVLVIAGAEDPGTTPAMNKAIADAIPGAGYVELAGAAHFCNVQAADAFNVALTTFLAAQKARLTRES